MKLIIRLIGPLLAFTDDPPCPPRQRLSNSPLSPQPAPAPVPPRIPTSTPTSIPGWLSSLGWMLLCVGYTFGLLKLWCWFDVKYVLPH